VNTPEPITIARAQGEADLAHIHALFTEYQQWLGVDLCFQGFDQELRDLPGKYAEPAGCLLLARVGDRVAGGVALLPLDEEACEMKRLYVRPPWLGCGLGRRLAMAIMEEGRRCGYRRMFLDTLPQLTAALGLYRSLGFAQTEPYYDNPLDGVSYMAREL